MKNFVNSESEDDGWSKWSDEVRLTLHPGLIIARHVSNKATGSSGDVPFCIWIFTPFRNPGIGCGWRDWILWRCVSASASRAPSGPFPRFATAHGRDALTRMCDYLSLSEFRILARIRFMPQICKRARISRQTPHFPLTPGQWVATNPAGSA